MNPDYFVWDFLNLDFGYTLLTRSVPPSTIIIIILILFCNVRETISLSLF